MTSYVYNNFLQLPPIGVDEGDIAFVKENSSVYVYEDLSVISSFSYSFDGASSVIINDSSYQSIDSQNVPFTIDFWSYKFSDNYPYFSIFSNENISTIEDKSEDSNSLSYDSSVEVLPNSPYNINYDQSIYFNGDSSILTTELISSYNSLDPYTFQFYLSNENLTGRKNFFSLSDDNGDIIRMNNEKIIVNNVKYEIDTPNFPFDTWAHHALVFDGYSYKYFKDGVPQTITRDPNFTVNPGKISYTDIKNNIDAGFQAKVFFSSTPNDGTLFLIGEGDESSEISITGGGSTLSFKCRDLVGTTTNFPKDDLFHIVSYDIQIEPKKIRLWIDGNLEIDISEGSAFTNNVWYLTSSTPIKKLTNGNISNSDLSIPTSYFYYFQRDLPSINPIIQGENLQTSYGYVQKSIPYYFNVGGAFPLIQPDGQNIYYFETTVPYSSNTWAYHRPFIIDPNNNFGDYWYTSDWYGLTHRGYRFGTNEVGGVNSFNVSYWHYRGRIRSFIIDEQRSSIYSFEDGRIIGSTDLFGAGNMSTGTSGGFTLGFQHPRQYQSYTHSILFDENSWSFDPYSLYSLTLGDVGNYAYSNNFVSLDGMDQNSEPLYYYPKTFSTFNNSLQIGKLRRFFTRTDNGNQYAQNYVSSSSSIINVSPTDNLLDKITGASNGDVILLAPGVYNISINTQTIFQSKKILICGDTSDPSNVILNVTHSNTFRDHPIFDDDSTQNTQLAFLTYKRISAKTTNYMVAICKFSKGSKSYNVIFDFNNKPTAWLYDNSYFQFEKYFENCIFKNYSNWSGNYRGNAASIVSVNNIFEGNYLDTSTNIGYNDKNCEIDLQNSVYTTEPFEGYIKDFNINKGELYDSNFDLNLVKNFVDSNTLLFLNSERRGDTLLSLNTNGEVIVNNQVKNITPVPSNQWNHQVVQYNPDSSKISFYVNGSLDSQLDIDLSEFSVAKSDFYIGKSLRLDTPTATFVDSFYEGSIKDFRLVDSSTYSGNSYTLPTEDEVLDSSDLLLTANLSSVPDTNKVTIQNNIQSDLFSPYTNSSRGWIQTAITTQSWNNVTIANDEILFDLDSFAHIDSFGINAIISFSNQDDKGFDIVWDYEANQIVPIFDIYRRDTNQFLIKRKIMNNEHPSASATFNFNPVRKNGDPAEFFFLPRNVTDAMDNFEIYIEASNISLTNIPAITQFAYKHLNIERVDSNTDLTGFVLDSADQYSIFANDINARIYDSEGQLL